MVGGGGLGLGLCASGAAPGCGLCVVPCCEAGIWAGPGVPETSEVRGFWGPRVKTSEPRFGGAETRVSRVLKSGPETSVSGF